MALTTALGRDMPNRGRLRIESTPDSISMLVSRRLTAVSLPVSKLKNDKCDQNISQKDRLAMN